MKWKSEGWFAFVASLFFLNKKKKIALSYVLIFARVYMCVYVCVCVRAAHIQIGLLIHGDLGRPIAPVEETVRRVSPPLP